MIQTHFKFKLILNSNQKCFKLHHYKYTFLYVLESHVALTIEYEKFFYVKHFQNGCWRMSALKCAGGKLVGLVTGILGVGGEECVLTELNQLLTSTGIGPRFKKTLLQGNHLGFSMHKLSIHVLSTLFLQGQSHFQMSLNFK